LLIKLRVRSAIDLPTKRSVPLDNSGHAVAAPASPSAVECRHQLTEPDARRLRIVRSHYQGSHVLSDRLIINGAVSGILYRMDAITDVPLPTNEPVHDYAPGSSERARLTAALKTLAADPIDLPHVIGGDHRMGEGDRIDVVQPHRHSARLGTMTNARHADATAAIDAAMAAKPDWEATPFDERAAVLLRAADLLAGPWREKLAAATMLGQSKTAYQAEIDTPCELIDFWRFNVAFARRIMAEQPISSRGVWNRTDYRPLEGFVYAITPFNFTAIAGNLPTAPALMGNTVVWKPSPTQTFAAYLIMQLLEAAGLPPGVINLLTGDGIAVSEVALADPRLAGIHFTGSTGTFQHLWREVGTNIDRYHTYPRLVGETGGKDFVLAHSSARPDVLRTALIRGAFDFQGQKCSAASRAFVPRSVWQQMGDDFLSATGALRYGDVTDLSNYGGAVIDGRAFAKNVQAIERAKSAANVTVAAGGEYDDSEGYFVRPTVLLSDDPTDESFCNEYFGPILSVHVYPDSDYDRILDVVDTGAKYGLTGAVIADDRAAVLKAQQRLRHTAGNFYVNDKPTGAVVGQQPFGGSRASGTNDKAGSSLNLLRWTSARSIKETFVPSTDHNYPHMEG
jgi:1-pyrroline-5-carboxylate dehydrogenase